MGSIEPPVVNIIDIRRDGYLTSLSDAVKSSLAPHDGSEPSLPTLLLYDEKGLQLFEDITYLDEYYLTNAEIEALSEHADQIAYRIPAGSRLVELGSGNLRKVDILLQAFERAMKPVEYYALDLSLSELQRTFAQINSNHYQYVSLNGLHGTYDDGLEWIAASPDVARPTCIMTLGSSIGNFSQEEAATFLKGFKDKLGPADWVLVGLDACQDSQRVFAAYNDSQGITEQFYRNGLDHANSLLGYTAFDQKQWGVEGVYNDIDHSHQACYRALADIKTPHFTFAKGQKIQLEYAYKYSEAQSDKLWHDAGMILQMSFGNKAGNYHLHLLSPSVINFSDDVSAYATGPVPSIDDWTRLWAAWDTATKSMVPREELINKPIQLRNALIFYLGHIPTFADIHFTKATGAKPTDPAYYMSIFERGIDPDVDNPESCHDHSEIPDTWPRLDEISGYSSRVRTRILDSVRSGTALKDRKLGRGLWLAYEHEAMHLETFLYMLLHSSKVLPPAGITRPDFQTLARAAQNERQANAWHPVPASQFKIGLDDLENDLPPNRYFGWDNERPSYSIDVPGFNSQSRCISNGEYAKFLEETKSTTIPAGWIVEDVSTPTCEGEDFTDNSTASDAFVLGKAVRTVFGPVPLQYCLDWPVMASYDELAAYATWAEAEIPTLEQARSIYRYVEKENELKAAQVPSTLISAVNGHLSNNGVEETPPSGTQQPNVAGGETCSDPNPKDIFIDLTDHNVGFKTWHPTPITGDSKRLRGQSDTGGLWEWTSSPLATYEGFKAMDLYPGYTADFFDDKHNIILGGSWATVPRIAGRKSFVNWYQRNYPYTWATARLVRNAE